MDWGKLAIVVAAVAGVTSWWLTNYAERVLAAPTLAFDISEAPPESTGPCKGFRQHELVLENLSTSSRLPSFKTVIRMTGDGTPFARPGQLGCSSRVDPIGVGEITAPSMAVYDSQISLVLSEGVVAGAVFRVPVYSSSDLDAEPVITFSSKGDMRILRHGFETWVLKNEFFILLIMSLFLIVGGGLVIVFGEKKA